MLEKSENQVNQMGMKMRINAICVTDVIVLAFRAILLNIAVVRSDQITASVQCGFSPLIRHNLS